MTQKQLKSTFLLSLILSCLFVIAGSLLQINWLFKTGIILIGFIILIGAVLIGWFEHTELFTFANKRVVFSDFPKRDVQLIKIGCVLLGIIGLFLIGVGIAITI